MKLDKIISELESVEITGEHDPEIGGITFDSRSVNKGDLFVAVRGTGTDGHDYIDQAIEGGAVAVVSEKPTRPGI